MVEPIHIFEGGVLDLVEVAPWSLRSDELCLVQANDRLGEGVDAPIGVTVENGRRPPSKYSIDP